MGIATGVFKPSGVNWDVCRVPASQPLVWLQKGWEDFKRHRGASLAYGMLVSGMGVVILVFEFHPYFVAAAISGFVIVGPVIATGLCELSRRSRTGEPTSFDDSLEALSRNRTALLHFGGILLGASVVWLGLSTVMLSLAFGNAVPALGDMLWGSDLTRMTATQILTYLIVGGVLAAAVFAVSVVSVPLIIHRGTPALDAMRTSARATLANLPAMAVWSGLIVVLIAVAFATLLLAMVVVFPLLGHATWYAYEDLVAP